MKILVQRRVLGKLIVMMSGRSRRVMMNKLPPFCLVWLGRFGVSSAACRGRRVHLRKGNSVDISLSNHTGLFDIYAVCMAQLK